MESVEMQQRRAEHENCKSGDGEESRRDSVPFLSKEHTHEKICTRRIPRPHEYGGSDRHYRPGKIGVGVLGIDVEGDEGEQENEDDETGGNACLGQDAIITSALSRISKGCHFPPNDLGFVNTTSMSDLSLRVVTLKGAHSATEESRYPLHGGTLRFAQSDNISVLCAQENSALHRAPSMIAFIDLSLPSRIESLLRTNYVSANSQAETRCALTACHSATRRRA